MEAAVGRALAGQQLRPGGAAAAAAVAAAAVDEAGPTSKRARIDTSGCVATGGGGGGGDGGGGDGVGGGGETVVAAAVTGEPVAQEPLSRRAMRRARDKDGARPPQAAFDYSRYRRRHVALKLVYFGQEYHGLSAQGDLPTIEACGARGTRAPRRP